MAGRHANTIRNEGEEKEIIIEIVADNIQIGNAHKARMVNVIYVVEFSKATCLESGVKP